MALERYLLEDDSGYYLLENGADRYLLESSDVPPGPVALQNYLAVKVGNGMSTSEKIR